MENIPKIEICRHFIALSRHKSLRIYGCKFYDCFLPVTMVITSSNYRILSVSFIVSSIYWNFVFIPKWICVQLVKYDFELWTTKPLKCEVFTFAQNTKRYTFVQPNWRVLPIWFEYNVHQWEKFSHLARHHVMYLLWAIH